MTTPSPKRRRRWFQFSLRTLLVFVLLVSIGMSWFAVKMQRARKQKEAVEVIERLGGRVEYTEYSVSGSDWRRRLLGDDFVRAVGLVELHSYFGDSPSDEDLAHLGGLPKLESLSLVSNRVTDAGLVHIGSLSTLKRLHLFSPEISDAGLIHLENLTDLRELVLTGTRITDAGLVHLEGLSKLEYLDLEGTEVTGAGFRHLENLSALKFLVLNRTPTTDEQLAYLKQYKTLSWLELCDTQVSDSGLVYLKSLSNLRQLHLPGTQVTPQGVAQLQQELPACEIVYPKRRLQIARPYTEPTLLEKAEHEPVPRADDPFGD
jgi:hypothetical protein